MKPLQQGVFVLLLLLSMIFVASAYSQIGPPQVALDLQAGKFVARGQEVRIPVLATALDQDTGIAGAAFSIAFNNDALKFIGAESDFFGTFTSHGISPASVTVGTAPDEETYFSPLVTNTLNGLAMLAAARPDEQVIALGDTVVLFELIFAAEEGTDPNAAAENSPIELRFSEINNPAAGYDPVPPATGVPIAALIGANPQLQPTDPGAFPEVAGVFAADPVMLAVHPANDWDNDGLSNDEEESWNTDPLLADTDGDGLTDFQEVNGVNGFTSNPTKVDTDSDGAPDGFEVASDSDPDDAEETPAFVYLQGEVSVDENWTTVDLSSVDFYDPVVIATPATLEESDATFVQLRNVSAASFEIRLKDAGHFATPDPAHALETVYYFVAERGQYRFNSGARIFAGIEESKAQSKAGVTQKYKFSVPKSLKLKKTPMVFASVISGDSVAPVAIRINTPSKKGFSYVMQEEQAKTTGPGVENFAYVAVEPFMGIEGANVIEVGVKKKAASHLETTLTSGLFNEIAAKPTGFVASLQTIADKDPAILRLKQLDTAGTTGQATLQIVEDLSLDDAKTEHKAETVAYMFFTALNSSENSDGEGYTDIEEYFIYGTDPFLADTDGDGLDDNEEGEGSTAGTDANDPDSDGDGFSDGQEVFAGSLPLDKTDQPTAHIEVAMEPDVDDTGIQVTFDSPFFNPVIVAGPADDSADQDPTFIQIYDLVTNTDGFYTGFSMKLMDAGTGGTHAAEMVHWMAMDAGKYMLENGKRLYAGKFESKPQTKANKFAKMAFPKRFFKTTPVAFAAIEEPADLIEPAFVRLDKVSKTSFSYCLQEDSANQATGGHGAELVSVIAMEPFAYLFGEEGSEVVLEVGSRGKAFDDTIDPLKPGDNIIYFSESHLDEDPEGNPLFPLFLAKMQTAYDKDSAQLRIFDNTLNANMVALYVQEDDADGEGDTTHKKPETVGYLATSPIDEGDTDGDGLGNDEEVYFTKTDPENRDSDGDGLIDGDEITAGTDPNKWDTDGDGFGDGHEAGFESGTGVLDATEFPYPVFEVLEMELDQNDPNFADIEFTTAFYDPVIVASTSEYGKFQWNGDPSVDPSVQGLPLPGEELDAAIVQLKKTGGVLTPPTWKIRLNRLPVAGEVDPPTAPQLKKIFITIIERGVYRHPDNGNVLIADSVDYVQTKKGKVKKVKFPKNAKIKKVAVVFGSVITTAEAEDNPLYHRFSKVSRKGFSFMFQEAEADDQVTKTAQTLSYMAWGGKSIPIEGEITAHIEGVPGQDHFGFSVGLAKKGYVMPFPSSDDAAFMLDMQSTYDKDPANVRYSQMWDFDADPDIDDPSMIGPMISEDFSLDQEGMRDKPEDMGQLRFFELP